MERGGRRRGPLREAIRLLKEDWHTHEPRGRPWLQPGFHALAVHRLGRAVEGVSGPARRPIRLVRRGLLFFTHAVYGIEVPLEATVGRRVQFAHQGGIVIAADAVIGDDCVIRQNVTIGAADDGRPSPKLGHGVRVGAGAVLIGDITIGDDVLIGPNAVVTSDVPQGASVVAPAARVIVRPSRERELTEAGPAESQPSPPTADEVIALLNETLPLSVSVDAETPLLTSGLVDSLNLATLLDAIEARFGVTVPAESATESELDTPRQIAEFISGLAD
jgi:serine O-acetyltransferase